MTDSELREFTSSVRALLSKHSDSTAVRAAMTTAPGYDTALWRRLCEQIGVAALAVPEQYGGIGAGLLESCVVVTELGRVLADVPMLGSAVLGVQALLLSEDEQACARLLPEMAEGSSVAAVCWAGATGWDEFGVTANGNELTGTAHYVLHGEHADTVLVLTASGLYEADTARITRRTVATMDPTRRLTEVTFAGTPARRLGSVDPIVITERLRRVGWAALVAEQVGAAQRCLDLTVEYSKSRVQFGRPIGSFQALKHRMADMYVLLESAKSTAQLAIRSVAEDEPSAAEDIWVARVRCTEALDAIAAETIQLHGGIAITWEHDAQLFFKRAHGDHQLFGTPHRPATTM